MRACLTVIALIGVVALRFGFEAGPAAAQERRVALVIGNASYKGAPLKNPVNDARAMTVKLRELGFEVVARENATRVSMGAAVNEFTSKLSPGSVALIFYAGHGIQSRGRNYLIPVDAALNTETDLGFQAVDIGLLTAELDQARTRVSFVILDACRNNPFERKLRGAGAGLAAVDAARGTLIAYATAPGSVAADGDRENGVYTEALLKALTLPGLKAEEVFKRVRIDVSAATANQQMPWESSSLTGDFVFNAVGGVAASAAASSADREALFWNSIKDSRRAEDYADYLARYPAGDFAGIARRRLNELSTAQAAATPVYTQEPPRPAANVAAVVPGPASPPSAGSAAVVSPNDGIWLGQFTRTTSYMDHNCRSSRSEFVVANDRVVGGSYTLDDGRKFKFEKDDLGRLEFEGVFGAGGKIDIKMRAFDNFDTNFMNIFYRGQLRQDTAEGDWRDDFGHCRGVFKLERKR